MKNYVGVVGVGGEGRHFVSENAEKTKLKNDRLPLSDGDRSLAWMRFVKGALAISLPGSGWDVRGHVQRALRVALVHCRPDASINGPFVIAEGKAVEGSLFPATVEAVQAAEQVLNEAGWERESDMQA